MKEKKYWAEYGDILLGPYTTREDSLAAMVSHLNKQLDLKVRWNDRIITGYGADRPFFDIRYTNVQKALGRKELS